MCKTCNLKMKIACKTYSEEMVKSHKVIIPREFNKQQS